MKKFPLGKLILSLALPISMGAVAGIVTTDAIPAWYEMLNKPSFNPPNWIFGPVWTTLYVLMGISFFMIWRQPTSKPRNTALVIFLIQMVLNFAWSFIFFYFKELGWALAEIILLWIMIVAMIKTFYGQRPIAGYLNIPYLLWVTFATILNAAYFSLN